ncbi:MAG: PAS domain S-box protein [Methanolobus sp.]
MSAESNYYNCKNFMFPCPEHDGELDLFSRLGMGAIGLDSENTVLHFNSVLETITAIKAEDIVGRNLNILSSGLLKRYSSFFGQLVLLNRQESDILKPVKIVTHDGCLKYFSFNSVSYSLGGKNGKLFILKDETISTVCSNKCLFNSDELDVSHLPFVSFLWKANDVWAVEYVSDNIVQFGYNPDDFISGKLSYADIIHPEYLESVKEAVSECGGDCFSKEYMILTSKNEPRWVLERSYAIRDSHGNITHFHGAVLDIHDRKNFEKQLENMNVQEKALSKLGGKALSCNDINKLMEYATEIVAHTLGTEYCIIMEKLPDERFLLRYGYGINELCLGSIIVDNYGASPSGFTVFSGKPLIVDDIKQETRFSVPRFLFEHNIVSGASVIIGNKENPSGVLFAYSGKQRQFGEHDIHFLQSVANILAETINLRESFNSLELYKKLINRSNDYILVLDTVSKKLIYASERVIQDLGYSESEIMEKDVFDSDCFMKALDILDVIRKASDEGTYVVCSEFVRKNGTVFPVDISFSFVENEGKIYMVLIGRDVTEQKKAHQILSESEAKLSTVFNNASDIICLSETDGTILEVSGTMLDSMGYTKKELIGISVEDVTAPAFSRDVTHLLDEIVEQDTITVEIEIIRKDGTSLPLEMKCQIIEYNGYKRILSVGRDISERRILERAIRDHSEQLEYSNEIKNMFADVTSHDLISSVSLIEGFASYLSDLEEEGEKKRYLSHILSSTDKLRKTIDSSAVFARMSSATEMEVQTMDLRHAFHNSLDRLLDEVVSSNIRVTLNSPSTCPAYVNPIIEEVFFNLMSNAIKYSPENSEVVVDIFKDGEMWQVNVSDNGRGISDKDKDRIFKRFSRVSNTDVCGKGLGLSISRMALKCHGQELHVKDNKSGSGTTFWFRVQVSHEFDDFQ